MISTVSTDDRLAIADLIGTFFWLIDSGRAAEVAPLFTSKGRLTFGPGSPKPGTVEGADIAVAMTARQAQINVTTRHVVSNIRMEARHDGSVAAHSLLTLYRSENEILDSVPRSISDIFDILVIADGSWRILQRDIIPVFHKV